MNGIDFCVIVLLIIGGYRGWKYGMFTAILSLIGTIALFTIGYYLKNPLSELMYTYLPFRNYGGLFLGISSFNILVYEAFAYVIVVFVLAVIFKVIMNVTGIFDKFIKMTMVLALPSKITGLVVGVIQWFVYAFILIYVCAQVPFTAKMVNTSNIAKPIFEHTPLLSQITNNVYHAVTEVYDVVKLHKDQPTERRMADYETLDVLLKYDVISPSSARKLVSRNKLRIENANELINKYDGKTNKIRTAADKIYDEAQNRLKGDNENDQVSGER